VIEMRKRLAVAGAGAALAGSVALAAPAAAAGSETIVADCAGQTVTVTTSSSTSDNARNFYSAARIQGGGAFVPYVLTITGLDLHGNVVFRSTNTKLAPVPSGAVTCTFSQVVPGMGTFSGTVTGVIRGH
jgi:hypothetical protein